MYKKIYHRLINIRYYEEKKKLILFGILLLSLLFFSFYLLSRAYASYQSNAKLYANIDKALYIFGGEKMSFNIDSSKIIPSNEPYTYKFSVSNFDANRHSDINFQYTVDVRSTTNLPINIKLYKDNDLQTNILGTATLVTDSDGAWYRVYETSDTYLMNYSDKITDIYTFSVEFPKIYADDVTYADAIENIEITLKSKQVI